ncbi:MAG: hypothetical protein R2856_39590 [Caldilineaceae bacterium]
MLRVSSVCWSTPEVSNGASGNTYRVRPITFAIDMPNDDPNNPLDGYVNFVPTNRGPAPDVGGTLKVASFNVLNYFVTLDTGGDLWPQQCSGLPRRRLKVTASATNYGALLKLDADVVG